MAEPTTAAPAAQTPGALASVSGWFSDFVKGVTPIAQTYLTVQAQRYAAKDNARSVAQIQAESNAAAKKAENDWRATVADQAKPVTAQPWFPYAVGGGVLLLLGVVLLAFRGKK